MYFLLKSQQNFRTYLKLSFLFTLISNISSKSFQDDWSQEWKTMLQLFPDFTSLSNTYVFRELQANTFLEFISSNTVSNNIDLFRAHIKHYSHFHRVITKNSKCFIENLNRHLNRQKILKQKIPK